MLRAALRRSRSAFLCSMASMLFLALMVSCGGSGGGSPEKEQEAAQEEQQAPVAGQFVGELSDATNTFLALVADEPQNGEEARGVRAYICDGADISEWFVDEVSADEVQLTSEGGAQLAANLTPETATGTITLPDGQSLDFEAPPATGIEGYYPVTVSPDGQLSGTTWGDARVEGQVTGQGVLSATFTPPEGEAVNLEASDPILQFDEEWRWIVLTEGGQPRLKGSKVGKSGGLSIGHPDTGFTGGGTDPSDSR